MATYSGLWDGVHEEAYALQVNRNPLNRRIGRELRKRGLTRVREVIDTVKSGESINAAAAVNYKRVQANADPGEPIVNGGAITIETVEQIAAASTTSAGDATTIDNIVGFDTQPTTYPADLSGNGGGSKLSGLSY